MPGEDSTDLVQQFDEFVEENNEDTETDETEDEDEAEEDASENETEEEDDDESDDEDEDEDDDYEVNEDDEEEEDQKPAATRTPDPALAETDINKYILAGLQKIPVRIITGNANDDKADKVQTVQVYGYGDLPEDFKGYASPREGELFRGQVTAQQGEARKLADQFNAKQAQAKAEKDLAEYNTRENRAIRDDLQELRSEGLFPKFKGTPGSKEFNSSAGAKEFDRVIKFMNEKNDAYLKAANSGKNYRHIGFREAYDMLHGPNPKAKEQAEDNTRKTIASKTKSRRGSDASKQTVKTGRVSNLKDLDAEFLAMYPEEK